MRDVASALLPPDILPQNPDPVPAPNPTPPPVSADVPVSAPAAGKPTIPHEWVEYTLKELGFKTCVES